MKLESILTALLVLIPFVPHTVAQVVDTTPPVFVTGPTVTANTNPAAPLTARLQLTTDEPTRIELSIQEATRTWRTSPSPKFRTTHDWPLIGLRPGRTHRIQVNVFDAAGNRTKWPVGIVYTTPPLPANFPPLNVTTSQPALMEPGVTLTSLRWASPTISGAGTYCVYLDATGQVVWLYETSFGIRDVIRLRDGNFLLSSSTRLAQEVDLFGNVVQQWWAARTGTTGAPAGATLVDCDSFHHELHELLGTDTANFIALSSEVRAYPNYPSSETDLTQTTPSANVLGDVIVEFKRDGTLVRECKLLDVVDPYRVCYNSLAALSNPIYPGITPYDWSHGNAVVVDNTDDTWIISLRSQDAVVKIRRADHSIVWIHGPHERWNAPWSQYLLTPVGGTFEWNFHEHAPRMDSAGNLQMFDNGNYRVVPPAIPAATDQWYSRLVRFHVDPNAMTTQQLWEYRGPPAFFSGQLGDADFLATTGNVLGTDGAKPVPAMNKQFSRVFEVTSGGTLVWEVIVNDPTQPVVNPYNWNVYRSERYSNVYTHANN